MKSSRLSYIGALIIAAALLIILAIQVERTYPRAVDSALKTMDALPFSYAKQLKRTYGSFYKLVETGTSGVPIALDPRIRSGARAIIGEAQQVRQKFPHHGSVPTEDLYLILCHGISGYTIKRNYINAPYPVFSQPRRDRELPVPANTPLVFDFTTNIDVDTIESATISVRSDAPTTCTLELLDSLPGPPTPMGIAHAEVKRDRATTLTFPKPVRLIDSHGATPYIVRFTFSEDVHIAVGRASRPDRRIRIGEQLYRDTEPTGGILGHLVDTRDYTLMLTPVHNGFVYGRTAVLNELGITPPYSSTDVAAIGAHALAQSKTKN